MTIKSVFPLTTISDDLPAEQLVGQRVRELRSSRNHSLRSLAELSGLNINTLSLIENGKTSPSVSTLQQLAKALEVPITAFFEAETVSQQVVFTSHDARPGTTFGLTQMQNLGKNLEHNAVQPFVVTLPPNAGSGEQSIVHTGYEFVYCLFGQVRYSVAETEYTLEPGDSLVFEAHLRHQWINVSSGESQILLVLYPADPRNEPAGRHFPA
jgi:Predicted transcriptional regulators